MEKINKYILPLLNLDVLIKIQAKLKKKKKKT